MQEAAHQPPWVPVLADEGDAPLQDREPPASPVSPGPGRGELARGGGWCRGHRARVSPVNGLVVPGACAAGCQLGSR